VAIDSKALDAGRAYRFQLRLTLGTVVPAATVSSARGLEAEIRAAGLALSRRAELVADALHRLGERGWRPLITAPIGREVLAGQGFAGPDGAALPEAVTVARDAPPAEVTADLAGVDPDLTAVLAEGLTVRVEDLDLPVVLSGGSAELRYSPREYLETFSVRS
jgi:hypothetical protein